MGRGGERGGHSHPVIGPPALMRRRQSLRNLIYSMTGQNGPKILILITQAVRKSHLQALLGYAVGYDIGLFVPGL